MNEYLSKFSLEKSMNILANEYIFPKYSNLFKYQNISQDFFGLTLAIFILCVINIPGVAGAVLHKALSLSNLFAEQSFSSRSYKHHKSQTVRARELKF